VQGYTPRKNQSSHGGWDSVNGPVSPRRDILRDWTRTLYKFSLRPGHVGRPIAVHRYPLRVYTALHDGGMITNNPCRLVVLDIP